MKTKASDVCKISLAQHLCFQILIEKLLQCNYSTINHQKFLRRSQRHLFRVFYSKSLIKHTHTQTHTRVRANEFNTCQTSSISIPPENVRKPLWNLSFLTLLGGIEMEHFLEMG